MSLGKLKFEKVNRFIPFIIILGIGLGVADYSMGSDQNIFQLILLHLFTTFIIGYLLLTFVYNKEVLFFFTKAVWLRYFIFIIIFMIIGIFASEIELILRSKLLTNEAYLPFEGGNMYLYNAIITAMVGLGTVFSIALLEASKEEKSTVPEVSTKNESQKLTRIPTKQGENVILIPIQDILYFESYDNYSFVFSSDGSKRLCDFSLKFLEARLNENFLRIHRKYIVNKSQIESIKPHLNSRYIIEMAGENKISISSSKTYVAVVKSLIKLS